MSPQNIHGERRDITESTSTILKCLALDEDKRLVPANGELLACILCGACSVQRWVAGHWIEQATFLKGGLLLATGATPIQVVWKSVPEGLALALDTESAAIGLPNIVKALSAESMLRLPLDLVTISLAKALGTADHLAVDNGVKGQVIALMVARINEISQGHLVSKQPGARALPPWRFRQVESFVQARLGVGISLADMAAASGLSPMYFAAQFKAATGMRPHEYLLLQRIEQAKIMLRNSKVSILDVAISVGFQTQGHFSTVFKRMEKRTPNDWRRLSLAA